MQLHSWYSCCEWMRWAPRMRVACSRPMLRLVWHLWGSAFALPSLQAWRMVTQGNSFLFFPIETSWQFCNCFWNIFFFKLSFWLNKINMSHGCVLRMVHDFWSVVVRSTLLFSVARVHFQRSKLNRPAQPNKSKPQTIAHATLGWRADWWCLFFKTRGEAEWFWNPEHLITSFFFHSRPTLSGIPSPPCHLSVLPVWIRNSLKVSEQKCFNPQVVCF